MIDSILTSIKKLLGLTEDCTDFDSDIIININTVFMDLRQLGVGPTEGFSIEDDSAKWVEFIDIETYPEKIALLSAAKSYIHLKVKLQFDPPLSSAVEKAINERIDELEWRLNVEAETNE